MRDAKDEIYVCFESCRGQQDIFCEFTHLGR